MKPTVKITWGDLTKAGLSVQDLISLETLGNYGFCNDTIMGLIKFDILPQTYYIRGKVMVLRRDIFAVVNMFLKNSIALYETVATNDKLTKDYQETLEKSGVKITPEDFEAIEAGTATLHSIITERQRHAQIDPMVELSVVPAPEGTEAF